MIICASRRTDIPAFHMEWLMNRLRGGRVFVRNPIQKSVVYDISLKKRDVDCIIFITKNPMPLENYLDEIIEMGYQLLFQVTINPYERDIEPNVPKYEDVIDSFIRISDKIGTDRMLWRYDPVIFFGKYGMEFHHNNLTHMSKKLEGKTKKCTFSFLTYYDKLSEKYEKNILGPANKKDEESFLRMMPKVLNPRGIVVTSCCETSDHIRFGIEHKGCIDSGVLKSLNIPYEKQSVPYRDGCLCVKCIDIGAYDTCMHNCIYCYANHNDRLQRERRVYDPNNLFLYGKINDSDRVIKIGSRKSARITDF